MKGKLFLLLALLFCTLFWLPDRVFVASCISCYTIKQGPPCQEFWQADAVFAGFVTEVIAVDWSGTNTVPYSTYRRLTARVAIEQTFRGVQTSEVVFEMNDCPYPFKLGERYLVYARKDKDGKLFQRIGHSRTQPLSEAQEDLEFLRGLSSTQPGTLVYGKAISHALNIKESRYDIEPLRGVKVIFKGKDESYEAATDEDGKYEFVGLAAGSYRVRAMLPDHLVFKEHDIKVTGQGCLPLDIGASRVLHIAGRVLNVDGDPLTSVEVTLVSADATLEEMFSDYKKKRAWTFTDKDGRFAFSHLASGRYLLIINRSEYEKGLGNERAKTLQRFFYPGGATMAEAEVIDLRDGRKAREYDFRLPIR